MRGQGAPSVPPPRSVTRLPQRSRGGDFRMRSCPSVLQVFLVLLGLTAVVAGPARGQAPKGSAPAPKPGPAHDPFAAARNRMVERHLVDHGIKDPRVLEAFRTVP